MYIHISCIYVLRDVVVVGDRLLDAEAVLGRVLHHHGEVLRA